MRDFSAKLAHFRAACEREVDAHRKKILQELAAELRAAGDAATGEARNHADARVNAAREAARRNVNRAVAAAEQKARMEYEKTREAYENGIRRDAAQDLAEFSAAPEYESYLERRIQAAKLIGGERFTRAVPVDGGGFILLSDDEKSRMDYSFARLLGEM